MDKYRLSVDQAVAIFLEKLNGFDACCDAFSEVELLKIKIADSLLHALGLPTSPPNDSCNPSHHIHSVPARIPKAGFVYLMQNCRNHLFKIGFSRNPQHRERTLQSEEPEVELLWSRPGTRINEIVFHTKFRDKRVRGEWFRLDADDVASICQGELPQ